MQEATYTDIKRFAVHDGPGIRTTLFLKGCPLKCIWCHNPESISPLRQLAFYSHRCTACGECAEYCPEKAHSIVDGKHIFDRSKCAFCGICEKECPVFALKIYGRKISLDEAVSIAMEDVPFYQGSGGGITVSGGEPLVQKEFTITFLEKMKSNGVHTALDTCAFVPQHSLKEALPVTDLFLVDFKHFDSEQHKKLTGQPNDLIKENLAFLSDSGAAIEIRIPFVPGCNDAPLNIRQTGEFLGKLNIREIKLLPYHSLARSKYSALEMTDTMPEAESPAEEQIQDAVKILQSFGLNAKSGRE
ncbi:MAG: glycyl-radical enzyme activating protein [Lentisphaerae bacterium]|nr:glycyl-radical enzyme activating protein [Lentisphaerota bacterium]